MTLAGRAQIDEFESMFRDYRKPVFNLLLRMTGSHDRALDLTQEVFVRALQGWAELRDRARVRGWIFRIARNVALRGMDQDRRGRTEPLESVAGVLESTEARPDEQFMQQEEKRALQRALDSLPTGMRLVLLLRDMEGLEYRQIAQVLGCSEGTVASRLSRARQLVGRKLADSKIERSR